MKNPKCEIKNKKLGLPSKNNLIPKNFDIIPKNEKYFKKDPVLNKKWDDTRLWYKKDDEFKVPKAIVSMKLYTSDCEFGVTQKGKIFSNLYNSVMEECLREFNAKCANANVYFNNIMTLDNMDLEWSGYNDSMHNLISDSITHLLKVKETEGLEEIFN